MNVYIYMYVCVCLCVYVNINLKIGASLPTGATKTKNAVPHYNIKTQHNTRHTQL
jgi:hypothetical protein